jgi:DNA-binding NtrC family response regulator
MTGHGTIETAVEATRLGAFNFVPKPFTPEELAKVAVEALAA